MQHKINRLAVFNLFLFLVVMSGVIYFGSNNFDLSEPIKVYMKCGELVCQWLAIIFAIRGVHKLNQEINKISLPRLIYEIAKDLFYPISKPCILTIGKSNLPMLTSQIELQNNFEPTAEDVKSVEVRLEEVLLRVKELEDKQTISSSHISEIKSVSNNQSEVISGLMNQLNSEKNANIKSAINAELIAIMLLIVSSIFGFFS